MVDLLIKNGRVIDGSGAGAVKLDVAVNDGKIVEMAPSLELDANRVIDASGFVVCPGFVDIHSHSDATITVNPRAESKIRQGVTTEVVGNCGMSAAPLTKEFMADLKDHLTINSDFGAAETLGESWQTFGEYIDCLNALPLGINMMPLVGFGTLRSAVMGHKIGPPTADEMARMEELLEQSLDAGAAGLSTGLEYVPESFVKTEELIQLCKVVARKDKLYATHMRSEAQTLFPAIEEAVRTSEESGCRLQISHLKLGGKFNWGKTEQLFELLENAVARGVRLSWDQYPYTAWGTGLVDYIPAWVAKDGHEQLVKYLSDPEIRKKIRQEIEREIDRGSHAYNTAPWENVQIAMTRSKANKALMGRKIADIVKERGVDPFDFIFDLLIAEKGMVKTLVFCMDEADIMTILQHPQTIISSDARAVATYGELSKGSPHPRYYGAFPRILGKYVREEKLMPLETAIKKMTSMPAKIMGLDKRGTLAPAMVADITIFNPDTITDLATFENPHQYSKGIEQVILSGKVVIDQETHTGQMMGRII
ncbi:N-acyl-D-amino-acid deacylase [hydrothermal vent metagenome]|uniref:N-acyl-D-amino-acid deacylase n=1 Tax=hydrothermal vent metagenome TaxID=652676 RepID=A0A3B0TEI0_9ZZZZ